ncbi:ATM [Bugula neritina]|uniref:ATM n=1 Tax=Bugula neritina TaxID=10212 RepID=A0A7J7IX85_BUGNE|nr:ATM [Bugula neritina]
MPSKISELIAACGKLASGKVLERKKAAERLKCLLNVPEVLKHLDKGTHSLQNDGFGFSWISVFEAAADALEKELKSQRPSNSSITAGVKKPEMYGTIKCVLVQSHGRTTSEGKAVLNPEVVFDHMWIILSDYSHILASEYAYLLVNYFLTESLWRHWEKPNLALLSKMLSKFVKGIAQSSQGFTTGPIPHVIKKLSAFLTARIDLKPMKFLSLFKEFFLQAKDSNSQTLENMLDAVNIICERSAANCHMRLSSFGTDLAMNMLQLWQNNAKQRLKMEIIRFFSLQVVLHGDDSDTSWQTALWKLYEVMCQEIGNTKPSHRLTGDNLNPVLTEEFFNLTGQVCLKLLSDGDKLTEVSQMASQSSFSVRPPKRRKVQSGWECIKSEMVNAKDFRTQIAWIKVIKAIVELSDDSSLSDEQLADVLQVMYQVLAENKRSVVFVEVNKCLCVLSTQHRLLAEEHDVTWRKILAVSISLVERRQVEFYKLITSMLKLGKRLEQTQYVRLIKSSTAAPHSAEGLHWLQCYLSMFELGLCPILSATERELDLEHSSLVKHTQGQHLWQHTWVANQLLPGLEDDNGLYRVVAASQTVSADLFGQVMASLVCRDPIPPPTPVTQHEETVIRHIQELYDSMTFTPVSRSLPAVTSSQVTLLQPGADQVAAVLARKLTALSDLLDQNENTSSYIEDGFWMMEMCLTFLNICSVQQIIRCVLPALQDLWRRSVQYISQQLRQKSTHSMLPNLHSILSQHYTMLSTHCSDDARKLVLALISHIHVLMQETTTLSQGSSWSCSASNSSSIDDEFSTPSASTGFLQQLDSNFPSTSSTLSKGSSHHQMLTSMKLLVFIASELQDCRPDILDLVTKLCSDKSTNYANVAIVTMEMIIGHWQNANLETFLNILFHTSCIIYLYMVQESIRLLNSS